MALGPLSEDSPLNPAITLPSSLLSWLMHDISAEHFCDCFHSPNISYSAFLFFILITHRALPDLQHGS
jgi:hypothetical protein